VSEARGVRKERGRGERWGRRGERGEREEEGREERSGREGDLDAT